MFQRPSAEEIRSHNARAKRLKVLLWGTLILVVLVADWCARFLSEALYHRSPGHNAWPDLSYLVLQRGLIVAILLVLIFAVILVARMRRRSS